MGRIFSPFNIVTQSRVLDLLSEWVEQVAPKPDGHFMISDNANNPQVLSAFEVNSLSVSTMVAFLNCQFQRIRCTFRLGELMNENILLGSFKNVA